MGLGQLVGVLVLQAASASGNDERAWISEDPSVLWPAFRGQQSGSHGQAG